MRLVAQYFYEYSYDGRHETNSEFGTIESARLSSMEDHEEACHEIGGWNNWEIVVSPVTYFKYKYDEDDNKILVETIEGEVEYEHEPSMEYQHGTNWGL